MARARNIKPAFFINTELSEIPPLGRLAFIGLWTICDFKGCLECNIKKIKAQILPYDECDFHSLMNNLEQFRFIRYYVVQDKTYIKILNFEKHQNPHKNERDAGSDLPDISENNILNNELAKDGTKPDLIGSARADSLIPLTDSLNIDSIIKTSRTSSLDDGFHEFWKAYPKKVGKDAAIKMWQRKKPKVDLIINALKWQIKHDQWQKGIIPNPATYLNEGRWQDEPASAVPEWKSKNSNFEGAI